MNNLLSRVTETKNKLVNGIVGSTLLLIATCLVLVVINIDPSTISINL